MYIAWIWLVPTAYFFAAYMKPAMPGGAWFQVSLCLSNRCCNACCCWCTHSTWTHACSASAKAAPLCNIYIYLVMYIQYILPVECDILAGLFVCAGTSCSDVDCPRFQCSRVHCDLCGHA